MERSDSTRRNQGQLPPLELALSNLHLSSTSSPNPLYNRDDSIRLFRVQEPDQFTNLTVAPPRTPLLRPPATGRVAGLRLNNAAPPPLPNPIYPELYQIYPYQQCNRTNNLPSDSPYIGNQSIWAPPISYLDTRPAPLLAPEPDLNVVSLSMHMPTSKILQEWIGTLSRERIEPLIRQMICHIEEMMVHPTANYVVQKLIDIANDVQKYWIVDSLTRKRSLFMLCSDTHGTRVMQKLVENLESATQKELLLSVLRPDVLQLSKNDNGRHVILNCLRNFSDSENQPILIEMARHCYKMGTDKSGYLVLTECVNSTVWGPNGLLVMNEITRNAPYLAQDQFGNYVVQNVLERHIMKFTTDILGQLQGKFVNLASDKYGSNVVEKCLKCSMKEQSEWIIDELIHSPKSSTLVDHPYANYVINTALHLSKSRGSDFHHNQLLELLKANRGGMRNSRYGQELHKWIASLR